jgi:hypothetical protein
MIIIKSITFSNNELIPQKYACDGKDINPNLCIENVPEDAKSLVIIVDDPDALKGLWTHWIVFNINPNVREIKEDSLPLNGVLGTNTSGKIGYEGPCPPKGETHHYFFKVYALDVVLSLLTEGSQRSEIEKAMEGHIIDKGELMGIYFRN